MAVLSRFLATTFGVGAAAFAPSGGIRGLPQQQHSAGQQQQPGTSSAAGVSLAAVGVAAVLTAGVGSRRSAKPARVIRNSVQLGTQRDLEGERKLFQAEGSPDTHASWRAYSSQEVGVCFPITDKWDPLNLGNTDMKMERYTAVEIKHGRISMIAVLGYIMPEIFRFPGCENFDHGVKALSSIPVEGWFQLVALIGAHEALLKPGTRVGAINGADYGFGTEVFDTVNEEEKARRQTVERNNGRLAMIAIMGLLVQDCSFDDTPIQMIAKNGFYGPPVDFLVKDIGACMGYTYCATKERSARTIMRSGYSEVYTAFENGRYPPAPGQEWDDDWGNTDPNAEPEMSPSMPFLRMPKHLKGWVGGEKGFDPLGVTDALPVYWVREAELKHGRVCMLATLGWIATDLGLRFPGEIFQDVSTVGAHDKMVDEGLMLPFLGAIGVAEIYGLFLIIEGWGGEIDRSAGDFFLGKNFLPKDISAQKDVKLKELENGRLAMIAFGGIATQAVFTGKTWPFFD